MQQNAETVFKHQGVLADKGHHAFFVEGVLSGRPARNP